MSVADIYELETRFYSIATDPVDLVRLLMRKLERTPAYSTFVSILHNIAFVCIHFFIFSNFYPHSFSFFNLQVASGKAAMKLRSWREIEAAVNRIVLRDAAASTSTVDISMLVLTLHSFFYPLLI